MSVDPLLDGITLDEWHKSLPPSSPGVGSLVVTRAELLALIARVREDAVRDYAEAHYANKMQRSQERYEQGQRDEREACIAAVEAEIAKWHPIGASGPCVCHGGEHRAVAAIRAREEKP